MLTRIKIERELGNYATLIESDKAVDFIMFEVKKRFNSLLEELIDYQDFRKATEKYWLKQAFIDRAANSENATVME